MTEKVLDLLRSRKDLGAIEICNELNIGMTELRRIVNDLNRNRDNLFIEEFHVYRFSNYMDIDAPKIVFVLQEN